MINGPSCIGGESNMRFDELAVGETREFSIRLRIERQSEHGFAVGAAVPTVDYFPGSENLAGVTGYAVLGALMCANLRGVGTCPILMNRDPAYNDARRRLVGGLNALIVPMLEPHHDENGNIVLMEDYQWATKRGIAPVVGLLGVAGEIDLALFLQFEIEHNIEMLNAIPPGRKPMDLSFFGVSRYAINAACMAIEHALKMVTTLSDIGYDVRKHRRHNNTIWESIVTDYPGTADAIVEQYNNMPEPWDDFFSCDPVDVDGMKSILALLDGGLYERSRYPYEVAPDPTLDESVVEFDHHRLVLPLIRVAAAATGVAASTLESVGNKKTMPP